MSRRAVFVCCDGLGRNWIGPQTTPVLQDLQSRSLWCPEHAAVFPSVLRARVAAAMEAKHDGTAAELLVAHGDSHRVSGELTNAK